MLLASLVITVQLHTRAHGRVFALWVMAPPAFAVLSLGLVLFPIDTQRLKRVHYALGELNRDELNDVDRAEGAFNAALDADYKFIEAGQGFRPAFRPGPGVLFGDRPRRIRPGRLSQPPVVAPGSGLGTPAIPHRPAQPLLAARQSHHAGIAQGSRG